MKELLISKILYKKLQEKAPRSESSLFSTIRTHPISPNLCKRIVQVKTHKKRRINKKWAKRYGFREEELFYLIDPSKLIPRLNPKWSFLQNKEENDKKKFKVRLDFSNIL